MSYSDTYIPQKTFKKYVFIVSYTFKDGHPPLIKRGFKAKADAIEYVKNKTARYQCSQYNTSMNTYNGHPIDKIIISDRIEVN